MGSGVDSELWNVQGGDFKQVSKSHHTIDFKYILLLIETKFCSQHPAMRGIHSAETSNLTIGAK